MSETREFITGDFCWADLGTDDPEAAKRFYRGIFDWSARDRPAGDVNGYSILHVGTRDVAALYPLCAEQRARGDRPHWMSYILVDNVDRVARRARDLGAALLAAPFDVGTHGRTAVLADPTGATFALWQARHAESGKAHERHHGALCWNELATPDTRAAREFYRALFGWVVEEERLGDFTYYHLFNRGRHIGGLLGTTSDGDDGSARWTVYFNVTDCTRSVEQARALGATVTIAPTDILHVGRFAVIHDPQGARLSLFEPMRDRQSRRASAAWSA